MLGALFQAFAGQLAPPPYQGKYRAFPVLHAPGAGKAQLEEGDKILLPQSAFEALARLRVTYPMLFEITNPMVPALRTHCGVMEFSAEEGVAYLPLWMMDGLALEPGSLITVSNVALQKGTFVKLQPHLTSFTRLSNPRVVLEKALRKFSCLTKGNTIRIHYGDQKFDLDVVEVKPAGAVSIIETDMQVDFAPPKDYKEDFKTAASSSSSAPSVPGSSAFAMRNNDDDTKQQIAFEKAAAAVLAADVEGTSSWASAPAATAAAAAAAANGGTPGKGDPSYFSKLSGGQSLSGRKKKTGTTPLVGPIAGSSASIPPLTASPARPVTGAGVTPPPIAVTPNLKRPHSSNVTPSPTLSRAGSTTGTPSTSSNGGYVTVTKPGHSSSSSGSESPVKKAPALIRSSSDGSGATTTGSSRPNSAAAARWAAYTPNGATESKLTTTPSSGSIGGPVKRAPQSSTSPAPSSSSMPPPSSPALTARAASGSSLASPAAPIAVETTVTTVGNFDYIYEKGPHDATPRLVKRVSSKNGAATAGSGSATTTAGAPPAFVPFGGSGNKLK